MNEREIHDALLNAILKKVPGAFSDGLTEKLVRILESLDKHRLTANPKGSSDLVGACCIGTSCIGNLTQADCLTVGGVWYSAQFCPNFVCPG